MILVLQSRSDESGWHELRCIHRATGLKYSDLVVVNFGAPHISPEEIKRLAAKASGIIIGGLGEVTYGDQDPDKKQWFDGMRAAFLPVLREVIEGDVPVLGICFGHQLIAEALGASVGPDAQQAEMGPTSVNLNDAGRQDPLFAGMSELFMAIEAHRDVVAAFPKKATPLASSERCSVQAFRYRSSVYGVQFHPELTTDDFLERKALYIKSDGNDSTAQTQVDTYRIVRNFVAIAKTTKDHSASSKVSAA